MMLISAGNRWNLFLSIDFIFVATYAIIILQLTYLLTYSMEHSPSWETDQFSQLTKKFHALYGTRSFFTVLTSARLLSLSWERSILREGVPYVKLYRYNPKHLYQNLNGYGDNGHRKMWASMGSKYCTPSVTPYSSTAHARQRNH
jgi:hypothetical protein